MKPTKSPNACRNSDRARGRCSSSEDIALTHGRGQVSDEGALQSATVQRPYADAERCPSPNHHVPLEISDNVSLLGVYYTHSHPSWASPILSHCRRWLRESRFVSQGNLTQGSRPVCDENGARQRISRHKKHANTTSHMPHDMGGVAFFRANASLTITTILEHLRVHR
ncbi:hypothetical protein GE21DRAFT_1282680 [Neurospora crassa]|nr:hypothetical protein GE21DRAFT_1282680 [Neurospora crassa]